MGERRYVVALPRLVPEGLAEQRLGALRQIEGVDVIGITGRRAQIVAGELAIPLVRRALGDTAIVEPLEPRDLW